YPHTKSIWYREAARLVGTTGRDDGRVRLPSAKNYPATGMRPARSRRRAPGALACGWHDRRACPQGPEASETCVLSALSNSLEFETVARIHRGLAREALSIRAHNAGPDDNTVICFFREVELGRRFRNFRYDIFMPRKF